MCPTTEQTTCWLLVVTFVAGLVATSGCAVPPQQWRQRPMEAAKSPCGDWVFVWGMDKNPRLAGELFAVGSSGRDSGASPHPAVRSVYIHDGQQLIELTPDDYTALTAVHYNAYDDLLWLWTVGGMTGSLSHGLWGVLTIPTWLIAGGTASVLEFTKGRTRSETPKPAWARYPQGLPDPLELKAVSVQEYRSRSGPETPELRGKCPR